ncbi:MAG: hypothetical protein KDK28_03760 [Maritimibacter sp.]|nr:hypothetical protein [Maritimibacter sp.]
MFGILASTFRHATRTETFNQGTDRARRHIDHREEERRREREALDELVRYRRGYW